MSINYLFDAEADLLLISLSDAVPSSLRGLRITASLPDDDQQHYLGLAKINHRQVGRPRPDAVVKLPHAERIDVHVAPIVSRAEANFAFGATAILRDQPDVAMSESTRWALSRTDGGILQIEPVEEELSTLLPLSSVLSRHAGGTVFPSVPDHETGQPTRVGVYLSLVVPEDDPNREHLPWEQLHIEVGHDPATVLPEALEVMVMHFLASEDVAPMLEGKSRNRRPSANWRRVLFEEANKGTLTQITLPQVDPESTPGMTPEPLDHPIDFLDRVVVWTDPACEIEFQRATGETEISTNGMVTLVYLGNGRFARDEGAFNDIVSETHIGMLADAETAGHWSVETPELVSYINLGSEKVTLPIVQYTYASFAETIDAFGGANTVLEIEGYVDRPMLFELLADQDLYRAAALAGLGSPPAHADEQEQWLRRLSNARIDSLITTSNFPPAEKASMRANLDDWTRAIGGSPWRLLELTLFPDDALQMLRAGVLPEANDISADVQQFAKARNRIEDLTRARTLLPQAVASHLETARFVSLSSIDQEISRMDEYRRDWLSYLTTAAIHCELIEDEAGQGRSLVEGIRIDETPRLNSETAKRAAKMFEERTEGLPSPFAQESQTIDESTTLLRQRISLSFAKVIDQECQEIDDLVELHGLNTPVGQPVSLASAGTGNPGFASDAVPFMNQGAELGAMGAVVSRFPIVRRWKLQIQRQIQATSGPRSSAL